MVARARRAFASSSTTRMRSLAMGACLAKGGPFAAPRRARPPAGLAQGQPGGARAGEAAPRLGHGPQALAPHRAAAALAHPEAPRLDAPQRPLHLLQLPALRARQALAP